MAVVAPISVQDLSHVAALCAGSAVASLPRHSRTRRRAPHNGERGCHRRLALGGGPVRLALGGGSPRTTRGCS